MWDARQLGQMRGRSVERTDYSRTESCHDKKYFSRLFDNFTIRTNNTGNGA
jgi:hypothetical protein